MRYPLFRTFAALMLLPASRAEQWELHGFFGVPGTASVSLREAVSGESRWIRVGELDGEIYVESVDLKKECAVVYAGSARLVLRLRGGSVAGGGGRFADAGLPEPCDREPTEAAVVFRRKVAEGMRRLREEHPEYFEGATTPERMSELRLARRRVLEEAELAADDLK